MIGGERPLLPEISSQADPLERNRRFSVDICS